MSAPEMTWRPIESAPKDGTSFDVWGVDPAGDGYRVTNCFYNKYGDLIDNQGEWLLADEYFRPTHWMPLPEPPKPTGGSE